VCNAALSQGKFIRIHFGPSGKLAGADIETCKFNLELPSKIITTSYLHSGHKALHTWGSFYL
jgi:hypothetical protein